jgi:hypothetical protein
MARKKKSEGAAVRQAMDGPQVEYDELLNKHQIWATEEGDAASDAGTRRQQIGAFADKHGLNNKALSQFRAGMKQKKEDSRRDWVRSMEVLLAHARAAVFGNQPDMLDTTEAKDAKQPEPSEAEPAEEEEKIVPFDPDA